MNIETLTALGLSEEIATSLLAEINEALALEYERGKSEGATMLDDYKFSLALDKELSESGAKNPDLLKSLIDLDIISIENGVVSGLSEQIEKIKEKNPFLFEETAPCFTSRTKPTDKITKKSFEKMSYMDRVKLYSKNPTLYKQLNG